MKEQLRNPIRPVKNVRTVYDKFYQKNVKEVQVQFKDEDPARPLILLVFYENDFW